MKMRVLLILTSLLFSLGSLIGQDTYYSPGYQTIMMSNPAVTGSEGEGVLRLSYMNFYPGNSYNLHSVYLSYDSFFPAIHGGAGFCLSNDYLGGIINDIRGSFSYAYFLKAGREFYINAGLSASFYHRSFSFGNAILPEQIDPMGVISYPPGEVLNNTARTLFDIGTGFLFITGKVFGGFSVSHLAEPYLSKGGLPAEKLERRLLVHLAGDIDLGERKNLKLQPVTFAEFQGRYIAAGAGAVAGLNYLKFSTVFLTNNNKNIDIQSGFSLKTGNLMVYYNYRFNVVTGNNFLPFSVLHQIGLAFSLYNVEKRYDIKTINFPHL